MLPRVGRKTANVFLGNAFGRSEGVVVDTHVGRLSVRLGLTKEKDPIKVERELMPLFPRDEWTNVAHVLIFQADEFATRERRNATSVPSQRSVLPAGSSSVLVRRLLG